MQKQKPRLRRNSNILKPRSASRAVPMARDTKSFATGEPASEVAKLLECAGEAKRRRRFRLLGTSASPRRIPAQSGVALRLPPHQTLREAGMRCRVREAFGASRCIGTLWLRPPAGQPDLLTGPWDG